MNVAALIAGWASAGEPAEGVLFGRPFRPTGAFLIPHRPRPNAAFVWVFDDPASCSTMRAIDRGVDPGVRLDPALLLWFDDLRRSGEAAEIHVIGEHAGQPMRVRARILGLPPMADPEGLGPRIAFEAEGAGDSQVADRMRGEMALRVCEPPLAAWPGAAAGFEAVPWRWSGPVAHQITFFAPVGWESDGWGLQWRSPDGHAAYGMFSSPGDDPAAIEAALRAEIEATTGARLEAWLPLGDDLRVVRWTVGGGYDAHRYVRILHVDGALAGGACGLDAPVWVGDAWFVEATRRCLGLIPARRGALSTAGLSAPPEGGMIGAVGLWVAGASASELKAELFGAPFDPKTALGLADPAQPGVLSVLVADGALTCDTVRAAMGGKKSKKKPPFETAITLSFSDLRPGAEPAGVLIMGKAGLGALTGDAVLLEVPAAKGEVGRVRFALSAEGQQTDGPMGGMIASKPTDRVTGELEFTLCDAIAQRPSIANTAFSAEKVTLEEKSFGGGDVASMDVTAQLPAGWTRGPDPLGRNNQWTAPDGVTSLRLGFQTLGDPFLEKAAEHMKMQVEAFVTESTSAESLKAEAVGEGSYVARWRYRWADGPWTNKLQVFRFEAGWPQGLHCEASSDDAGASEVFDAAEAACLALTVAP